MICFISCPIYRLQSIETRHSLVFLLFLALTLQVSLKDFQIRHKHMPHTVRMEIPFFWLMCFIIIITVIMGNMLRCSERSLYGHCSVSVISGEASAVRSIIKI